MKIYLSTALAAVLVLSLPACQQQKSAGEDAAATAAAGSFEALNGTWTVDLASLKFQGRPDEYLLEDGNYNCVSCTPPYKITADGTMHAVPDRAYWDSASIKAVDANTVEFHRNKGGKEVSSMTQTVSSDGQMLTTKFKDMTTPGQTIEGTGTARRVGPVVEGAHAVSGKWQQDKIADYSKDALAVTYKVAGNMVTLNSQGQSYTAEIGGPAVPVQGDTAGTSVKLTAEGNGSLKETNIRDGKEVGYGIITPAADGKSVTYAFTDPRDGTGVTWTGNKGS